MEEGQLDGVLDLLDLVVQPADVVVADVRDLLQDQFLDLRLRELFEEVARPRVIEQMVPDAEPLGKKRLGKLGPPPPLSPPRDGRAPPAGIVPYADPLPPPVQPAGFDHAQRPLSNHP